MSEIGNFCGQGVHSMLHIDKRLTQGCVSQGSQIQRDIRLSVAFSLYSVSSSKQHFKSILQVCFLLTSKGTSTSCCKTSKQQTKKKQKNQKTDLIPDPILH